MSSTAMRNRVAATSLALVGALGLSACNSSDTSVTTPSSSSSSSSETSSATSETSSSTSESSTTSETPSSSSETSSSSSSEGSSSASGPTEPSAKNATFKFGEPAVIKDGDDLYRLTVKKLEVAPDSVYQEANLNKDNGVVYYTTFEVTPIKTNSTYFGTNSINGLFLYPSFSSGQKAKRLYGDTSACKSESKKLAVGETGSNCYIHQITGDKSSTVTYNNYSYRLKWQ